MARTRAVLDDPALAAKMIAHNYELARHHFSYRLLRDKLRVQLENVFGANGV